MTVERARRRHGAGIQRHADRAKPAALATRALRLIRLGRHVTVVDDLMPRTRSALQRDSPCEPSGGREVKPSEDVRHLAVLVGCRDKVLYLPDFVLIQIVKAADLIAASAGEPCIHGRGHAK